MFLLCPGKMFPCDSEVSGHWFYDFLIIKYTSLLNSQEAGMSTPYVQFLKLELYALFNIMFIIELYLIKLNKDRRCRESYSIAAH